MSVKSSLIHRDLRKLINKLQAVESQALGHFRNILKKGLSTYFRFGASYKRKDLK